MLGFLYLILILGWIIIVVFLKCKKAIAPHLTLETNLRDIERRPSVHVIQLPSDNFRETLEHQSIMNSQTRNFPSDACINPAYNHDEEFIASAPPPSYDEVMRQPDIYPKVQTKNT